MIKNTQNIQSESDLMRFFPPHIAQDYMAIKRDLESVISGYVPLKGNGSPEGIVIANHNGTYFDLSTNPVTMYVNEFGNKTGWKLA